MTVSNCKVETSDVLWGTGAAGMDTTSAPYGNGANAHDVTRRASRPGNAPRTGQSGRDHAPDTSGYPPQVPEQCRKIGRLGDQMVTVLREDRLRSRCKLCRKRGNDSVPSAA